LIAEQEEVVDSLDILSEVMPTDIARVKRSWRI